MSLTKKVAKGTAWSSFSQIVRQILSFGIMVILARLLNPSDFGLFGMSIVFTGFISIFRSLGLGTAIIQRKKINNLYLSTAFWATLGMGCFLCIITILISPLITLFFKKELIRNIVIISSFGFIISSLSSIHINLLQREMKFNKIAVIEISGSIVYGAVAISIALMGYGVWSLVFGTLAEAFLLIPIYWYATGWIPKLNFSKKYFKNLFGFGSNVLGFNIINYFARNLDNLLIGRFLGASALGYYALAYNLMLKPLRYISWNVGRVLFPAFSSIQGNKQRVRNAYLKVISYISLITFPMMIGLFFVAPEFVKVFYGEKWVPTILILQILCFVGAIQSIGTTVGTIFYSQGRPDIQLKWGVFATPIVAIAFFIGLKWNIQGVATAYAVASGMLWLISHKIANSLIDLKMKKFLAKLYPAALASLGMLSILFVYKYFQKIFINMGDLYFLFSSVFIGIIVYITLITRVLNIKEVSEILNLAKEKLIPKLSFVHIKLKTRLKNNKFFR